MKTLNEIHRYWKKPNDGKNKALLYCKPSFLASSELLWGIASSYIDENKRVLEIGCNVGRNLNFLLEQGFKDLSGIEINKKAISLMSKVYPDSYGSIDIYSGAAEDILQEMPSDSFDLVFTMAVLMHIHPESLSVFYDMVRISKKYIITIEYEEPSNKDRIFQRDYEQIFEDLGMKQIFHEEVGEIKSDVPTMANYQIRVFKK